MELLLFLLLAGLFVALVVYLIRYAKRRDDARRQEYRGLATSRRWQYEEPGGTIWCRLRARDEITWQLDLEVDTSGESTSTSTQWTTNDIAYADLVALIRTRKGFELWQSMWGRAASGLLRVMASTVGAPSPQHEDVMHNGKRVEAASSVVNENFVIVLREGRGVDGLMTPSVEVALRRWAESGIANVQRDSLSIDIGQTNLRVYCTHTLEPQYIELMVALGRSVAAALLKLPPGSG
jgi:hypothetical protein